MADLEKLQQLRSKGRISEEEYEAEKKRIAGKVLKKDHAPQAKNGITFILLAWFLGTTGVHNFYVGYYWRGISQLALTLLAWLFMYVPLLFVALWVFLELLFVNRSANGLAFKGNRLVIAGLRIVAVVLLAMAFSYSSLIYNPEMSIGENMEVIG